jgi:FPC/CPF motif-containing protein YcgG
MYGKLGNLEWVQHFISDDGTPEARRCPLSLRPLHGATAEHADAQTFKLARSTDWS